jgi:hypothetical protein
LFYTRYQWPCNTPSEDSSESKTNTTTGKTTSVKISKNPKFEKNRFNIDEVRNFRISKFYNEMCVGGQTKFSSAMLPLMDPLAHSKVVRKCRKQMYSVFLGRVDFDSLVCDSIASSF